MNTASSYNQLAAEYTQRIYGELAHKPFDRKLLDWLVEKVKSSETICDLGCGPGHVARYLHDQGASACGIDLSPGMIEQAQILNPTIPFQTGDMLALSAIPDQRYGGIAAFYSIVHFPTVQLSQVFGEMFRVLLPGGVLLLTFHVGDEVRHFDELWGVTVNLDFVFFQTSEIKILLQAAGFVLEEVIERDPYPEIEAQTRRAYLFARKPG